jgi:hypothetical protein
VIPRAIKRHTDPRRAARYYTTGVTQRAPRGDQVPALLWLWLLIVGLIYVRQKRIPGASELVTLGVAGGIIVAIGNFAPHAVTLFLLALLLSGVLGAEPRVAALLAEFQSRVNVVGGGFGLTTGGGGGTPPNVL